MHSEMKERKQLKIAERGADTYLSFCSTCVDSSEGCLAPPLFAPASSGPRRLCCLRRAQRTRSGVEVNLVIVIR